MEDMDRCAMDSKSAIAEDNIGETSRLLKNSAFHRDFTFSFE
jgi:hypothetical protein